MSETNWADTMETTSERQVGQRFRLGIGNASVLSGAGMVSREHEERDGSMLSLELRIPFVPRGVVAPTAQRLGRASPSAQTRGDQVLVASRVANEGGLAKDALAHGSISRKGRDGQGRPLAPPTDELDHGAEDADTKGESAMLPA